MPMSQAASTYTALARLIGMLTLSSQEWKERWARRRIVNYTSFSGYVLRGDPGNSMEYNLGRLPRSIYDQILEEDAAALRLHRTKPRARQA